MFVFLLRLCNPDARKALVRESLDVLTPILAKRLQAGACSSGHITMHAGGVWDQRTHVLESFDGAWR